MLLEPRYVHAPEIHVPGEAEIWLNTPPLPLAELRGRVVLLDFWDFTCVNCLRTLPHLRRWHELYASAGLTVIGIHSAEFNFGRIPEHVQRGLEEWRIPYAVLLDNDYKLWRAYANRAWPSKHLIDKDGYLRFTHTGEGRYHDTETAIRELLLEANPGVKLAPMDPERDDSTAGAACFSRTPEIYLGWRRGRLLNPSGWQSEQAAVYRYPEQPGLDVAAVEVDGAWISREQFCQAAGPAGVRLRYAASEVNLVMATAPGSGPARLNVLLDGLPPEPHSCGDDLHEDPGGVTWVEIHRPRMYNLVRHDHFHEGVLGVTTESKGLQLYAFSFGC